MVRMFEALWMATDAILTGCWVVYPVVFLIVCVTHRGSFFERHGPKKEVEVSYWIRWYGVLWCDKIQAP
jgi:hypothetical protein